MKKSISRKLGVLALAVIMTVVFSMPAFAADASKTRKNSAVSSSYLISAKTAKSQVGKKNVLFVDCRGLSASAVKKQKTVKGAISVTWGNLSVKESGSKGGHATVIPSASKLSKMLSKYGLSKSKTIILFAQTSDGWGDDGRVLWELRAAGYTKAKMVNGGWKALKAAKVKTAAKFAKPKKASVKISKIDLSHNISTAQLHRNYSSYKVIDTRTTAEYKGSKHLYGVAKDGHLKNAIHIQYTDLFQKNGTLKSKEQIEKLFSSKGISKSDQIVTYCTGGIRSAYMEQVLEFCGYQHTYNYAASFWEWSAQYPGMVVK